MVYGVGAVKPQGSGVLNNDIYRRGWRWCIVLRATLLLFDWIDKEDLQYEGSECDGELRTKLSTGSCTSRKDLAACKILIARSCVCC